MIQMASNGFAEHPVQISRVSPAQRIHREWTQTCAQMIKHALLYRGLHPEPGAAIHATGVTLLQKGQVSKTSRDDSATAPIGVSHDCLPRQWDMSPDGFGG